MSEWPLKPDVKVGWYGWMDACMYIDIHGTIKGPRIPFSL